MKQRNMFFYLHFQNQNFSYNTFCFPLRRRNHLVHAIILVLAQTTAVNHLFSSTFSVYTFSAIFGHLSMNKTLLPTACNFCAITAP